MLFVCEPISQVNLGVVLVSTGILKLGKPSAGWGRISKPKLKYKRRRKFSVRCLIAAVGLRLLTT